MIKNNLLIEDERILPENVTIANDFLRVLNVQRSATTIDTYRRIIRKFLLDFPKPLRDVNDREVHIWYRSRFQECRPKTQNLVLTVLSRFFEFCVDEEYIQKNLVKRYWRQHIPQRHPRYLPQKELAHIRAVAESFPLRDRAIIEFLFLLECRRSEVARLKLRNHLTGVNKRKDV